MKSPHEKSVSEEYDEHLIVTGIGIKDHPHGLTFELECEDGRTIAFTNRSSLTGQARLEAAQNIMRAFQALNPTN